MPSHRRLSLDNLNGISEQIEARLNRAVGARATYYWISAIKDGRLVVLGPKTSEQEAFNWGYAKLGDVNFEVNNLPTRDMNAAVRMIKGKLLDKTANLDLSIRRARRKV